MNVKSDLDIDRDARFIKMQKDLFWECNRNLDIVYISNDTLVRECALLGKNVCNLFSALETHPYDADRLQQCLNSQASINNLRLGLHGNDQIVPVEMQLEPFYEQDEFSGFRGILRDVREIVRLETAEKLASIRFKILFETSQSYISLTDTRDLTYFDANPLLLEFHGKEKQEMIGTKSLAVSAMGKQELLEATIASLRKNEQLDETVLDVARRDGVVRTVKSVMALLPYEDCDRLAIISTDITPAIELKARNKTLNAILASMLQGITIIDDNLNLIFCNKRFLDLLEFPEEYSQPGTNLAEFLRYNAERGEYGPGDVDELVKSRIDLARQFAPHKFDRIRGDGISLEVEGHYIPDVGFISTYTDITERVQAEKDIRENERLLREIVDSLPFSFSLWQPDGTRILGNSVWLEWYQEYTHNEGDDENEVLKFTLEEFIRQGIRDGLVDPAPESVETYVRKRLEYFLNPPENMLDIKKYGDRWLQIINKKFPSGAVASIRIDVTDQYKREDQLRQAQKMEAVGQLTGGIAHDFNNLLAVILGNTELLAESMSEPSDAVSNNLNAIMRSSLRGAELTQQLLSFSRKMDLRPEITNLNQNIEEMLVLLESTVGESIFMETTLKDDLWSCFVDPGQVENSLLNLCINSRDAMTNGGVITIQTDNSTIHERQFEYVEDLISGEFVKFSVSDTGEGIQPAVMQQIFEPFFTTKDVGLGSGLGLSMVFGFVRQSNGYIDVQSEQDLGTKFDIYLPRHITD